MSILLDAFLDREIYPDGCIDLGINNCTYKFTPVIVKAFCYERPFRNEIRGLQKMNDTEVSPKVYSSFEIETGLKPFGWLGFVVMEKVEGTSLLFQERLKVIQGAIDATICLETLHEKGLVHGDAALRNIMYSNRTKIIDFEYCEENGYKWDWRAQGINDHLIPPENQTGSVTMNPALDVYALGRSISQLLATYDTVMCPSDHLNRFSRRILGLDPRPITMPELRAELLELRKGYVYEQ